MHRDIVKNTKSNKTDITVVEKIDKFYIKAKKLSNSKIFDSTRRYNYFEG